jgi:riboflavin kinase
MNIDIKDIEARLPHYAKGPIVKGFGRGSTELGFPTANFSEDVIEKLPQELVGGIYFGFGKVDDGPVHDMVMSVGWNPFYKNEKRAMETHIIHKYDGDLYGKMLSVIMVGFLRAEANYDSLEKLVEAIESDIENGQKYNLEEKFATFKTDQFFCS